MNLVVEMKLDTLLTSLRTLDRLNGEGLIFEGAQGILLDQDHGMVFPHVTRSHTTSKNALALMTELGIDPSYGEVCYVSRSYLTRHGAGPLPGEAAPLELRNNSKETNVTNEFQGGFRTAPLNERLLKYALAVDAEYAHRCKRGLVLTCLDQWDPPDFLSPLWTAQVDGVPIRAQSRGPTAEHVRGPTNSGL